MRYDLNSLCGIFVLPYSTLSVYYINFIKQNFNTSHYLRLTKSIFGDRTVEQFSNKLIKVIKSIRKYRIEVYKLCFVWSKQVKLSANLPLGTLT